MATFLALYHGNTVADCELVATSASPKLVQYIADELLKDEKDAKAKAKDPVRRQMSQGRTRALRLVGSKKQEVASIQ